MRIPDGFSEVFPYLFVSDPERYIAFARKALGGREMGRSVTPSGVIANCRIRFGAATIMVSQSSDAFPPSRSALYLYVEDADRAFVRAVSEGAEPVMPVDDMPYGDRQGGVRDPEGNIWWLSQRMVDTPFD